MSINPYETELWEGPEVEGRLIGLLTLFVGHNGNINSLDKVPDLKRYGHIYFNEGAVFNQDGFFDDTAKDRILRMTREGWYFTISINNLQQIEKIPASIAVYCHIVAVVEMPEFNELGLFDSLKIQGKDGYCWMIVKKQMVVTEPEDYEDDEIIETA